MFGIGGFELFLILLFGFLVFGPDKLPEIAKTVGSAIAKFKKAQEEMNSVIKTEVFDPNADEPFKNPLEVLSKKDKTPDDEPQESFAQRKARYDRERLERRKQEEIEANRAAMREQAAAAAREKDAAETPAHPVSKPEPTLSADELYGNKPLKPKPASSGSSRVSTEKATPVPASDADETTEQGKGE